jgi:hypothetical protein
VASTWYAFRGYNNGQAISASAFDSAELNALGFHGYPTQASAAAKPNSVNLLQAPIVNAAIDDANNARDVASSPGNAGKAAAAAAGVPLTGLAAVGDFFQRLTQGSTWLRIAEGLLGIILLAVGIARMTHAVPIATAIARKVP